MLVKNSASACHDRRVQNIEQHYSEGRVLRPRGRRRKSDHPFRIGNPGAGPRWLAEARHKSTFRHWETTAAATTVRNQSYTRGEAEVPGSACPSALFNAEKDADTQKQLKSDFKLFMRSFHFKEDWKYCIKLLALYKLSSSQRARVHFCPRHWLLCHWGLYYFEFEIYSIGPTDVTNVVALQLCVFAAFYQ